MYSTYAHADPGPSGALLVLLVIGLIGALVAYLSAIHVLVGVLKAKEGDWYLSSFMAWLIGIFTTPFLLALVVIAIPNRRALLHRDCGDASAGSSALPDDLPQI